MSSTLENFTIFKDEFYDLWFSDFSLYENLGYIFYKAGINNHFLFLKY